MLAGSFSLERLLPLHPQPLHHHWGACSKLVRESSAPGDPAALSCLVHSGNTCTRSPLLQGSAVVQPGHAARSVVLRQLAQARSGPFTFIQAGQWHHAAMAPSAGQWQHAAKAPPPLLQLGSGNTQPRAPLFHSPLGSGNTQRQGRAITHSWAVATRSSPQCSWAVATRSQGLTLVAGQWQHAA